VASRGQHASHQHPGRTSYWSPPPAAAARRARTTAHPHANGSNSTDDSIELLFYPRSHLDNTSLLHTHVLSNASSFHAIDIQQHTLMLYLSVGQLLFYRLRAEVHPSEHARKQTNSAQAVLAAQLAAALGVKQSLAFPAAVPYNTAPNAHDLLGTQHELRMTMELTYVVDLCAPLAPVISLPFAGHTAGQTPNTPQYESASLLAPLSTPPLQCRLWLTAADSLDQAQEFTQAATGKQEASNPPMVGAPTSDGLVEQQVYELPLFSPNAAPQALEALFQATTPNPANKRRLAGQPPSQQTGATTSKLKRSKVLTCMILTATGMLLAVDIGATVREQQAMLGTPNSPAGQFTPAPRGTHTTGTPVTVAWVRVVAQEVEQFWLHDMAQADPMHAALQHLHAQRKGPSQAAAALESTSAHRLVRGHRLFTYGSSGLGVWFRLPSQPSVAPGVPPSFRCNSLLDFDAEVYPLGLDSTIGVIVGITKGLRTRSATSGAMLTPMMSGMTPRWNDRRLSHERADAQKDGPSPFWGPVVCFRLQTQLQPYLHGVLMHLITNEHAAPAAAAPPADDGAEDAVVESSALSSALSKSLSPAALAQLEYAFQIANACRTHEFFSVSLELLLHTALTPPPSASFLRAHRSSSLAAVVSFLSRFPEFPDVVMSVARKNDAASWPRLFREAGSPQDLFALCLKQGKLRMASCYLVVIQRTEGMVAAREAATQIVQRIAQEEGELVEVSMPSGAPLVASTVSANASAAGVPHSLSVPSPAPSLSSSPSVSFRRRRRLSALESELQRFIALTREMEAEQQQMQLRQQAEEEEARRQQQLAEQERLQQQNTHAAATGTNVASGGAGLLPSPEPMSRATAAAGSAFGPATPGVTPSVTGGAPVVLFSPQPGVTPFVQTPGSGPAQIAERDRREPALPAVDEGEESNCVIS